MNKQSPGTSVSAGVAVPAAPRLRRVLPVVFGDPRAVRVCHRALHRAGCDVGADLREGRQRDLAQLPARQRGAGARQPQHQSVCPSLGVARFALQLHRAGPRSDRRCARRLGAAVRLHADGHVDAVRVRADRERTAEASDSAFSCPFWCSSRSAMLGSFYIAFRDIQLSAKMMLLLRGPVAAVRADPRRADLVEQRLRRSIARSSALEGATPSGALVGVVLVVFGFSGFESSTALGDEAKNPLKTIPRSVIQSVVLAGVFFITMSYVVVLGFEGSWEIARRQRSAAAYTRQLDRLGWSRHGDQRRHPAQLLLVHARRRSTRPRASYSRWRSTA